MVPDMPALWGGILRGKGRAARPAPVMVLRWERKGCTPRGRFVLKTSAAQGVLI